MGLFGWLINPFQSTIDMVVENAATQYEKAKRADKTIEEGEIASVLWAVRYAKARLSNEAERRHGRYSLAQFEVRNMVDFCLGTIDIELSVDPSNELHSKVGAKIVEGLRKREVLCSLDDVTDFQNRWLKDFRHL